MQRVLRKSSPASDNQISQASLPTWAGALFSCRLSSFWQSAGLQNHRPLVRIRPPSLREGYYKTETPVPDSDTGVLGGRGWITQAALLKTAHWAVFALSSATAPQLFESTRMKIQTFCKQKTASVSLHWRSFYGRGWIRTSSTITIRWMRFEIVMDSCAFFEFHQKSIIGYHNHLGTKTGYKVGYFARGEYSARASETAIAAVSALPSTAWLYQP